MVKERSGCFHRCMLGLAILVGVLALVGFIAYRVSLQGVRRDMTPEVRERFDAFFYEPVSIPEEWRQVEPVPEEARLIGERMCAMESEIVEGKYQDRLDTVLEGLEGPAEASPEQVGEARSILGEHAELGEFTLRLMEIPGYELGMFPICHEMSVCANVFLLHAVGARFRLEANLAAREGEWDEAFRNCSHALELCRRHPASPFMTHLVALVIQGKTAGTVVGLVKDCPDAGPLRQLLEDMNRLDPVLNIDLLGKLSFVDAVGRLRHMKRQGEDVDLSLRRPIIDLEEDWEEYWESKGNLSRYTQKERTLMKIPVVRSVMQQNFYRSYIQETGTNLETRERTTRAKYDLARLAIASRLYELEHGKAPASTADLAPAYFKEELIDPFSGKPYLFAKELGVFYSIGPDKTDDSAGLRYDRINGFSSAGGCFLRWTDGRPMTNAGKETR